MPHDTREAASGGEELRHEATFLLARLIASVADRRTRMGAPIAVDVQIMKTSAGADYFVRITCGDRDVAPHMFKERWKAEYEAAHYSWVFGLREDKPDLMAYAPAYHPVDA